MKPRAGHSLNYVSIALVALLAVLIYMRGWVSIPALLTSLVPPTTCRCLPGDSCWPDPDQWASLNDTLRGRLVAALPLGAPCHEPQYDADRCSEIRSAWSWPEIHIASPTSVMNPYFQLAGSSPCDPFLDASTVCAAGEHAQLAVNVSSADHVVAGLAFARAHGIRVVVKNTGHEYMGKSASGRGTLTLWTHHLSSASAIPSYASAYHNGSAVRLGAGILGAAAVDAARGAGLRIVGGFCPSVGIAGGYMQGGGHGPLSSSYGLAADQVLEWEVVTADGRHLVASPDAHADLYWALAGGGGGVFAVVVSVTVRAFPDTEPIGGASLVVQRSLQASDETYWESFAAWQSIVPALLERGATAGYAITRDAFFVQPVTILGVSSEEEMRGILEPLIARFTTLDVKYDLKVTTFGSYFEHYETYQGPLPWGPYVIDLLFGGRLVSRDTINTRQDEFVSTARRIVQETRAFLGFVALNTNDKLVGGPRIPPVAPNSALPAWRKAGLTVLAQSSWNFSAPREDGLARSREMTEVVVPALAKLTPDGQATGTYMNEADFGLVDWKTQFFGENWARLESIKKQWDPEDVFWAPRSAGADQWVLDSEGRLCNQQSPLRRALRRWYTES